MNKKYFDYFIKLRITNQNGKKNKIIKFLNKKSYSISMILNFIEMKNLKEC